MSCCCVGAGAQRGREQRDRLPLLVTRAVLWSGTAGGRGQPATASRTGPVASLRRCSRLASGTRRWRPPRWATAAHFFRLTPAAARAVSVPALPATVATAAAVVRGNALAAPRRRERAGAWRRRRRLDRRGRRQGWAAARVGGDRRRGAEDPMAAGTAREVGRCHKRCKEEEHPEPASASCEQRTMRVGGWEGQVR